MGINSTSEWVSVDNRLPKEGVIVLAYLNKERQFAIATILKNHWLIIENNPDSIERRKVTHWMPLPDIPEDSDAIKEFKKFIITQNFEHKDRLEAKRKELGLSNTLEELWDMAMNNDV